MKGSEAQSIDPLIKQPIVEPLVLKEDGDPARKFIGPQG
jgi:hypothetical protein